MEIKTILVPVDFSKCAASAVRYALFLKQKFGATVVVLHVINKSHLASLLRISPLSREETKKQVWNEHKRGLKEFLNQLGIDKQVETVICEGIPFQEIAKKAKEFAVDLIIMGEYGRMGQEDLERIFFGSTAEKVVRLLPCPVLCVPEKV